MGSATRTIEEMRDIINNDMRDIYERAEGEEDIREVLELEGAMELECERRDTDARIMIRGERQKSELVLLYHSSTTLQHSNHYHTTTCIQL